MTPREIRAELILRGINQRQIADQLGVSSNHLTHDQRASRRASGEPSPGRWASPFCVFPRGGWLSVVPILYHRDGRQRLSSIQVIVHGAGVRRASRGKTQAANFQASENQLSLFDVLGEIAAAQNQQTRRGSFGMSSAVRQGISEAIRRA